MPIYRGETRARPFKGDHRPANLYLGEIKLDGWSYQQQTGESVEFNGVFNDTLSSISVSGGTVTNSDYFAKTGLCSQVQTVQGENDIEGNVSAWEYGQYSITTGLKDTSNQRIRLKYLLKVIPSAAYYLNTNSSTYSFVIRAYDAYGTFLRSRGKIILGSWTAGSDEYYWSFTLFNNDSETGETSSHVLQLLQDGTIKPFMCLNFESDKTYVPFVPDSPAPYYPSDITPALSAGSYKVTADDGIYEVAVPHDLWGVGTNLDKVVFNGLTKTGYIDTRISSKVFDGTESMDSEAPHSSENYTAFTLMLSDVSTKSESVVCSHLPSLSYASIYLAQMQGISAQGAQGQKIILSISNATLGISASSTDTDKINAMKAWLTAQYAAGTPVTVYYVLAARVKADLTFAKVPSSEAPELPLIELTQTVPASPDYPLSIFDSGKCNLKVSDQAGVRQTVALPVLRKVGDTADALEYIGGGQWKLTQRVGVKIWTVTNNYGSENADYISVYERESDIRYPGMKNGILCDRFVIDNDSSSAKTKECAGWSGAGTVIGFCVAKSTAGILDTDTTDQKLAKANAIIRGSTIYYPLATPVETMLSLSDLLTYYPFTKIEQDGAVAATITAMAKVMDA